MAKIGLIQVDNKMSGDIGARQGVLIEFAEKCFEEGANLVFFSEAFQYVANKKILEDIDFLKETSEFWKQRCAELARKYHAYIVPWDYYVDDKGDVFNSSYILDRDGEFAGRYCKCNLTYGEVGNGVTRGSEIPVFDLDIGKVGIMICFDNYFPEVAATLGNNGAELILYPLYGDTLKVGWELKMRARAVDHSLYVASCQIDTRFDVAYTGVVDPEGNVIARLDGKNMYTVVDINPGCKVITNTACNKNIVGENLREYLHKSRNYAVFKSISEEGTAPLEWNDIFINKSDDWSF